MADRSCTVSFVNETRFKLTRINHDLETGHWVTEPPTVIEEWADKQKSPPIAVWKSAGPALNPFRGTEGFAEFRVNDVSEEILFEIVDAQGLRKLINGSNGIIKVEFGSPFSDPHWCNPSLRISEDILISSDPSQLYLVSSGQYGKGETDFGKEFWEALVQGPLNMLTWTGQHHPVYYVRIREKTPITDLGQTTQGLEAEIPQDRPTQRRFVENAAAQVWNGRWAHFIVGNKTDVIVEIRQDSNLSPTYSVTVTDDHRGFTSSYVAIPVTREIVVDYQEDVRRQPTFKIVENFPGRFPFGKREFTKLAPSARLESFKLGQNKEFQMKEVNFNLPGDVATTIVRLTDTLKLSDKLSLQLYALAEVGNVKAIKGYNVHYVERDDSSEVISSVMLGQLPTIR